MVVRGVDCSAFQREVSVETFRYLKAMGVDFFVPQLYGAGPDGLGPNPYLGQHVRAAVEAGLLVTGGYVWPPSAWPRAVEHWRSQLPDIPLKFLALDVEAGEEARPDHVHALRNAFIEPIIYTSFGQWQQIMGGSPLHDWFAQNDVRLWVASYPSRRFDGNWPETHIPSGYIPLPWQNRLDLIVGWQFAGNILMSGDLFDLNVFSPDWPATWPPAPGQGAEPAPQEPTGLPPFGSHEHILAELYKVLMKLEELHADVKRLLEGGHGG